MTQTKTRTTTKPARKKKPAPPGELTLRYDLADLPTSQHRAGLAGLVLMCDWLARNPEARRGTCALTRLDAHGIDLHLDRDGLAALFDQVYGADTEERPSPKPFHGKPPLREETHTQTSPKTGKTSDKTMYIYPVVVPRGAYLGDWEGDPRGPWRKLWRDMVWSILRGVPTTRTPFEARANRAPTRDADDIWAELGPPDASVELPSTYFLGAQAKTAENVRFRDLARNQLLLHFWPFVAQIYVPTVTDNDGKRKTRGYALAVPDVACLHDFCDELPPAMRERSADLSGYVPAAAKVDLAIESALDLMARLEQRLRLRESSSRNLDLVHGVDVFHVDKEGKNIRILGTGRVDIDPVMIDHYARLRDLYRDSVFRRRRILNLVAGHPWHAGFDRIAATVPTRQTIESPWFCADVRRAFEHEDAMNDLEHTHPEHTQKSTETLIYRLVGTYIAAKLASKYEMTWKTAWKDEGDSKSKEHEEYRKKRLKIAKDAFLAIRSRTGSDFVDYFSETICSGFQRLGEQDYAAVARALIDDTERVRTLTLLALSARS